MVYSDMKNKNKDFVLYAKASVFPVGHENHGKRLLMERGSVAFLRQSARWLASSRQRSASCQLGSGRMFLKRNLQFLTRAKKK